MTTERRFDLAPGSVAMGVRFRRGMARRLPASRVDRMGIEKTIDVPVATTWGSSSWSATARN